MSLTDDNATQFDTALRRLVAWAQARRLGSKLALALTVAVLASGIATYVAWTRVSPDGARSGVVLALIVVDLALLLSLAALVLRQLVRLWTERRSGSAGSRLHVRVVALFSVVAVGPAIIVAIFSALFFQLGLQSWFSDTVRTAVQGSVAVAEAYVGEHRESIRADLLAMANDLNREAPQVLRSRAVFNLTLKRQAAFRSLGEAVVFNTAGQVLARTTLSLSAAFGMVLPPDAIERANRGEVVIFASGTDDRVQAMIRLDNFVDAYLYVSRFIDPVVLQHVQRTNAAAQEYSALEGARSSVQLVSAVIFLVIALMLLLAAVWLGLTFANRIVQPISALVLGAERVRNGDLGARVPETVEEDELGTLSRAFNRMIAQLQHQRSEVVEANRQLDERRRFTEAVLSGVSAGVIGLDGEGRIELPNESALDYLDSDAVSLLGNRLVDLAPEFEPLIQRARQRPQRQIEGQIEVVRGGHRHIFMVRVAAEGRGEGARQGFVVTFDDVTELVTAQRMAAWADVARRIAHEIKNPHTPIQLSAERLRRRYRDEIRSKPEIFDRCTETIIRHVGDIRHMVDEFALFARLPSPSFARENVSELGRQAVFSRQTASAGLRILCAFDEEALYARCDGGQLNQVFTNLLKNAAEAIEARRERDGAAAPRGEIVLTIARRGERVEIRVEDNGIGLPDGGREELTEPYVTTREKGTGLGLAIVRKIVEDHGSRLVLGDSPLGGACLSFELDALEPPQAVLEAGEDRDRGEERRSGHGG